MVTKVSFTTVRTWEQPRFVWRMSGHSKCGARRPWNVIQTQKEEIVPFTTLWTKLEGNVVSEISQTEKDKYCTSLARRTFKTTNS